MNGAFYSPPSGAFEDMRAESSCKYTTREKEEIVERTRWHFGRVDSIKHHQSEGGSAFKVQVHLLIIPNNQF